MQEIFTETPRPKDSQSVQVALLQPAASVCDDNELSFCSRWFCNTSCSSLGLVCRTSNYWQHWWACNAGLRYCHLGLTNAEPLHEVCYHLCRPLVLILMYCMSSLQGTFLSNDSLQTATGSKAKRLVQCMCICQCMHGLQRV